MKRLHKSQSNRMLAGVCGGVAEFFGIDPTLVRIAWALLILFGGSGLLLYVVCAIIIPNDPGSDAYYPASRQDNDAGDNNGWR